jgi:hypothetical protein
VLLVAVVGSLWCVRRSEFVWGDLGLGGRRKGLSHSLDLG